METQDLSYWQEIIVKAARDSIYFKDFTTAELVEMEQYLKVHSVAKNTEIVHEGDKGQKVYFIVSGKVSVSKRQETGDHILTHLSSGAGFGEMALLGTALRTATVTAVEPCVLLSIDTEDFQRLSDRYPQTPYSKLLKNFAEELSSRLKATSLVTVQMLEKELQIQKRQNELGIFIIVVIMTTSVYYSSMRLMLSLSPPGLNSGFLSLPMIAIFSLCIFYVMWRSSFPLGFYGFVFTHWRQDMRESLQATGVFMLAMVILKWIAIHSFAMFAHKPLFDYGLTMASNAANWQSEFKIYFWTTVGYVLFVPLQEIIVRGGLQSSFASFLHGPHKQWWAILLSTVIFSATHAHLSPIAPLLVIPPGLFWGWMYARQKSLVGVTVSHIIIGLWGFYILGLDRMFQQF